MTEPAVTIRPARPDDRQPLCGFIEPFVAEGQLLPRTADEMDDLLRHGFIAEADGEVVGCAALEVYSKKLAEIRSLAVREEYRRHGVGKQLVAACVERARELNVLEVMAITASEEFFRACGFDFTLPGQKKALFIQTRES
jgi:N-acetylglutamate synthase-like GNAT family acetyltransferase